MDVRRYRRVLRQACALVVLVLLSVPGAAQAQAAKVDIVGPPGSGAFGTSVTVLPNGDFEVTDPLIGDGMTYLYDGETLALIGTQPVNADRDGAEPDRADEGGFTLPNGNTVVIDPLYDDGATPDVGAVSLYDGATQALISTLKGSAANDRVGNSSVKLVGGSNFVVSSPDWHDGTGAVTWVNGTTGVSGVVSAANSLVGTSFRDDVTCHCTYAASVSVLPSGNYLLVNSLWGNGRGAVTWGNGATGISGTVSEDTSVVGGAGDYIGGSNNEFRFGDVKMLGNGNIVVVSPDWGSSNGAVTFISGTEGLTGTVSAANSLVGASAFDFVGSGGVDELANGNYLVNSFEVADETGALTWGSGTAGVTGVVGSANSLVGSTPGDQVGLSVQTLPNGNYVVPVPRWDNGALEDVGAATWGNGATGTAGVVSPANSLVGSQAHDRVGRWVEVLTNGNYVVLSPQWQNGAAWAAGAVTWGNGQGGTVGSVSTANSLVGGREKDCVGDTDCSYVSSPNVEVLPNGNYVVRSPRWDNGAIADAGAVTWGNGQGGTLGLISAANSLIGGTAGDSIGIWETAVLTQSSNYVISNPGWHYGDVANAGATTWASGTGGTVGVVSAANSLVGTHFDDAYDRMDVVVLADGDYLVLNPHWNAGQGAVTWGDGESGVRGEISPANSLVGDGTGDFEATATSVVEFPDGNYALSAHGWDNGGAADAGAVIWNNGAGGATGRAGAAFGVFGAAAGGGARQTVVFNETHGYMIVGRPAENMVTVLRAPTNKMILNIITRLE